MISNSLCTIQGNKLYLKIDISPFKQKAFAYYSVLIELCTLVTDNLSLHSWLHSFYISNLFEGAYSPFSHLAVMCSRIKTVVIPKAIISLFNIALWWYQITKTIKSSACLIIKTELEKNLTYMKKANSTNLTDINVTENNSVQILIAAQTHLCEQGLIFQSKENKLMIAVCVCNVISSNEYLFCLPPLLYFNSHLFYISTNINFSLPYFKSFLTSLFLYCWNTLCKHFGE